MLKNPFTLTRQHGYKHKMILQSMMHRCSLNNPAALAQANKLTKLHTFVTSTICF